MNKHGTDYSYNAHLSVSICKRYFLNLCVLMASALLVAIILTQSRRHEIFGTTLMLGWDSPAYVWLAKYVLTKGPIHMIQAWSYPNLYTQLLAFLGYLYGDLVLVERILPLTFCILLIYTNSKIILKISSDVYIAGLTAFLTVLSINVLRLVSDLHRNLMALSLAFAAFLLVSNFDYEKSILNKKYIFLIIILFVIASTHFETYFILGFSLFLHGLLSRNWRKFLKLTFAIAIPVVLLFSILPSYFLGYVSTVVIFQQKWTLNDVFRWSGGSWLLLGFLIFGAYLVFKSKIRSNVLVSLIYSWSYVNLLVVILIGPISREWGLRSLYIMPIPLLLALAIYGFKSHLLEWQRKLILPFVRKGHSLEVNASRILLFIVLFAVIMGSMIAVIQDADSFLTPFIPRSQYEKIIRVKVYFADHNLSLPIVAFGGYPNLGFVNLYRNYIGSEVGEHFAYYGEISNLFRLLPSQPRVDPTSDPYLSQIEKYYLTTYYHELTGNTTVPLLYYHDFYVTNETLTSYPILIVTPDFYTEEIPYYVKPFDIGDGIYVIPPNSINLSEIK